MSLFNLFTKFNISEDDILSLDAKAILRLEKKIKAEIRLSESYNQNNATIFIDLLKNNKKELAVFYTDELTALRQIILKPAEINTEKIDIKIPNEFVKESFKVFLEKYAGEELRLYINNCFKDEYFNALYYLLDYASLFPTTILEEIQEKLRAKLSFAIEAINVNPIDLYLKLDFCVNPFFYRTLSRIGAIYFEEKIRLLAKIYAMEIKYLEIRTYFGFALKSFKASSEDLADFIHEMYTVSLNIGIEEVEYNPRTKRKTGTTVINLDKRTKASIQSRELRNKNNVSANYYTLYERKKPLIVLVGFILITIVLLLLTWNNISGR